MFSGVLLYCVVMCFLFFILYVVCVCACAYALMCVHVFIFCVFILFFYCFLFVLYCVCFYLLYVSFIHHNVWTLITYNVKVVCLCVGVCILRLCDISFFVCLFFF